MTKIYSKTDGCGIIRWCIKGSRILHREDGPAIERPDGRKFWFQNGNLHRVDGPAVEHADGRKEYWLNDKRYPNIKTNEEWIIFQIIN